jgi:GT2 family glycosyltransferase
VLENNGNPGYAVANNQAIRESRGRYVLLLNPDVILAPNALATAVQLMDAQPTVGIMGPRIVLPDGTLDRPCRRSFKTPGTYFFMLVGLTRAFPRHPRFGKYYLSWLDEHQPVDVDAVIGAFLLIRREVIDEIGMLDERFYMYCEDEDWCFRAKQAGWRIRYEPGVLVTHYKGSSSAKRPRRMIYERHKAILQFHCKNIAPQYSWPVNAAVYAGMLASLGLSLLRNSIRPRIRPSAAAFAVLTGERAGPTAQA